MPLVMKDNGNCEFEEPYFIHECHKDVRLERFKCTESRTEKGKLKLTLFIPQCCHDDEYEVEIMCCPFCGYKPGDKCP